MMAGQLPEKFHQKKMFRSVNKREKWGSSNPPFRFPKRKFGTTERSFRAQWCEAFPWVHYNAELDLAFCHLRMRASSLKREPSIAGG
jgi:hypothetical protein